MIREKTLKYKTALTNPETVVNAVRNLFKNSYREMVIVVGLDNRNLPNVLHVVGVGSPSQSQVHVGSIFKPLLLSNSSSFALVHNHPGNTLTPSSADRELTDRLVEVGKILEICLVDHLILNCDSSEYFSFQQAGYIRS
jgi:DNA repair protein RadC